MDTNVARGSRWSGVVRTACGVLFAGAIGVLLTRPDIAADARDALLGVLSVMLAVTALASERGEPADDDPAASFEETPVKQDSWRDGA